MPGCVGDVGERADGAAAVSSECAGCGDCTARVFDAAALGCGRRVATSATMRSSARAERRDEGAA